MKPYLRLFAALAVSYVVMFAVGYARTDVLGNVFLNLNRAYMAGMMVAPMLVIMLVVMGSMYENKRLNAALIAAGLGLTVLFWVLVRTQAGVGDRQFLRSMIPHHAAAILVCGEASVTDPRIEALCVEIVEAQEREIREMKAIMRDAE
jgi:uncharacterized protein (DUF305 family)